MKLSLRKYQMIVRLSERERNAVENLAKSKELSISTMIRMLIIEATKKINN